MDLLHWKQIKPNPLNKLVRGDIDERDLKGLAQSIRSEGVVQPLTVYPVNGHYVIQTGERRWRAARQLGDDAPLLPCVVVDNPGDEAEALITMGIENIQRRNLPPISEALYYSHLMDRGLTVPEIARRTGVRTSRIRRLLALLDLPEPVQNHINQKTFPISQVKAIAGLPADMMIEVVEKVSGKKISTVKQVVQLVKKRASRVASPQKRTAKEESEVEVLRRLSTELWAQLYHGAQLAVRMSEALAHAGEFELAEEGGDWGNQIIGSTKGAIDAVRRDKQN